MRIILAALTITLLACGPEEVPPDLGAACDADAGPSLPCSSDGRLLHCSEGRWDQLRNCPSMGLVCAPYNGLDDNGFENHWCLFPDGGLP